MINVVNHQRIPFAMAEKRHGFYKVVVHVRTAGELVPPFLFNGKNISVCHALKDLEFVIQL